MKELIQNMFGLRGKMLLKELSAAAELRSYQAGSGIYAIGAEQEYAFFLISGVCRYYYYDSNHQEYTHSFINEYGFPLSSAHATVKTFSGVEAVSDVEVIAIPASVVRSCNERYWEALWCCTNLETRALLLASEVSMMLRMPSASMRYEWFCTRYPEAEQKAAGRHIASFLGITPETLSRIRRKRRENGPVEVATMLYVPGTGDDVEALRAASVSGEHQFGHGPVKDRNG